ncbi:hypothetical protein [Pseudonocardia sp.]|jgi:sarcosine oxidase gamma subunit|uniref:hypothetical protein n=1 Tax=Pseudonocardia sp. TaxID=60912 RepID=UPI00261910E4|nr:hypothetical protein [Pseudonocardia sp.]MCW2720702.1 hypothetical protein [Pseudonocardia sp.]
MTFTHQTYRDILDAAGEDFRNPRPIGARSRAEEVIAGWQGPDPRIPEWQIRSDVPAKMQQDAAIAMTGGRAMSP